MRSFEIVEKLASGEWVPWHSKADDTWSILERGEGGRARTIVTAKSFNECVKEVKSKKPPISIALVREGRGKLKIFASVRGKPSKKVPPDPFCSYCGCVLEEFQEGNPRSRTMDHVVPVSRMKKRNKYVPHNRVPCCSECNNAKRAHSLLTFLLLKPYGMSVTASLEYALGTRKKDRLSPPARRMKSQRWLLLRTLRARAGMSYEALNGRR